MTLKELIEKLQAAIAAGVSEDCEVARIANMPTPVDVEVIDRKEGSCIVMARRES